MAHGITLEMRAIKRPEPQIVHQHEREPGIFGRLLTSTYVNPERDRSLPGKARIRARREAKRLQRRPFFKGHGVASENAYNQRYDCGDCGFGIVAPLDDFGFMADVMEHEGEHAS